jgi:hypothetical protein
MPARSCPPAAARHMVMAREPVPDDTCGSVLEGLVDEDIPARLELGDVVQVLVVGQRL